MDFSLFHDAGPIFWVIMVCGCAALAIFVERAVKLRQARIRYTDFLNGVFNILEKGKIREATSLCDDSPGPVVQLMHAAILHRDEPIDSLHHILENTGRAEISRMERRLAALSTIMHTAPLLGLLGSFLGVLETVLAVRGQVPAAQIQTLDITGGLVHALITSIAGLAVAIPSYAMHSILVVRIERIVLDMEQASGDIMAFMARWSSHMDLDEEKNAR